MRCLAPPPAGSVILNGQLQFLEIDFAAGRRCSAPLAAQTATMRPPADTQSRTSPGLALSKAPVNAYSDIRDSSHGNAFWPITLPKAARAETSSAPLPCGASGSEYSCCTMAARQPADGHRRSREQGQRGDYRRRKFRQPQHQSATGHIELPALAVMTRYTRAGETSMRFASYFQPGHWKHRIAAAVIDAGAVARGDTMRSGFLNLLV